MHPFAGAEKIDWRRLIATFIPPVFGVLFSFPPMPQPRNVLGTELEPCSYEPLTGFYRDGCCRTGKEDLGMHTICVQTTAEFLEFSRQVGNDLSKPIPQYMFPGLETGERWCLC